MKPQISVRYTVFLFRPAPRGVVEVSVVSLHVGIPSASVNSMDVPFQGV